MDYRTVLRAKGVKRIPAYAKLRTSKTNAKAGDLELVPNGAVKVRTSDLTDTTDTPMLRIVEAA